MRHRAPTRLSGVVATVVVLLPLSGAYAADGGRPDHPVTSRHASAGERALSAVETAFGAGSGQGGPPARRLRSGPSSDASLALRDLRVHLGDLTGRDRRTALGYLARPTSSGEFFGASYSAAAAPTSDCDEEPTLGAVRNSEFCIHYATKSSDRPPRADDDANGLPDQVDRTRTVMDHVWDDIVTKSGYDAPPSDRRAGGRVQRESRFDIYLVDIGDQGLYGYCAPETPTTTDRSSRAATSYCVLDDDFSSGQFPASNPLDNLRVTGAHEFFHSVQYAYDYREDTFFMENTATWAEDYLYPTIDDNRQYLPSSSMRWPDLPLDTYRFRYGNWIWWRYLTEQFPQTDPGSDLPLLVRQTWERAVSTYSIRALRLTLAALGTTLGPEVSGFGVANRRPAQHYEEGAAYPTAPLMRSYRLRPSHVRTSWKDVTLAQLSNQTFAFRPASSYGATWNLRIRVDAPNTRHAPYAEVTVVPVSGTPTTQVLPLASDGTGTLVVPFDAGTVRQVELTLTNAGHKYACNRGTSWACSGLPRDSGRTFAFRGISFRQ